jgi:hypothetical protein
MNFPSILPPSDLLRQVEGIERGLQQQRRIGTLGWLGVVVALAQAMALVLQSDYWTTLTSVNWHELLFGVDGKGGLVDQWQFLLALGVLVISVLLVSWKRFWLKESREPFRYTFAVADFPAITVEDPILVWLRHHLAKRVDQRIGRLSLLEEAAEPANGVAGDSGPERKRGAPAPRYESHVHISGHYGIRVERQQWILEVISRVRIGPPGSPERMARPEIYVLNEAFKDDREQKPKQLHPDAYEKLVERVYHSVATEIYRQITKDVQHKIDMLPTSYLKATAYLHEAGDYARSNTLVAFDEAERLFDAAIRLYDPARRRWPTSAIRWPGHLLRQVSAVIVKSGRWLAAFAWRRAAGAAMMVAKAEMGYANVLMDRRSLAGMSGYRLNAIFEARPVAERAVRKLKQLPRDIEGVPECLFDAHVTLALAWSFLGSRRKAKEELDEARRLLPIRATVDARFAYANGTIEARPRSRLLRFQRAVELDPKSEVAQFALAFEAEKLWRTRPGLEADVAKSIVEEYERVLSLDPGNIATWGNLGYMQWLLATGPERESRLAQAQQNFERGRDYKNIKRETYVAEIDYGLARIAAERGDINLAYSHFMSALTAHMAQATSQSDTDSWSSLSDYYFVRIDRAILDRFRCYREQAERFHGDAEHAPDVPPRVRDSVLAFVVNDYGEACYNYYKRSRDERYLERARESYRRSAELDGSYAIPRHNLFLLNKAEDPEEAERNAKDLNAVEPDWFEAKLAIMWKQARDAARKQHKADELHRERLGKLLDSAGARRAATADERDTSVYVSKGTVAAKERSTPYTKAMGARSKNVTADRLFRDADELEREREELLRDAEKDRKQAELILRDLVPHRWLWRGRLRRSLTPETVLRSATKRWRLNREWRWEREFDNVHVKALYDWGWALLSPGARRSASDRIFAHIEEHFWQDNFDIVRHFREQVDQSIQDVLVDLRASLRTIRVTRAPGLDPRQGWGGLRDLLEQLRMVRLPTPRNLELRYQRRIDKYNAILAGAVRARLDDDPRAYWALSGINDGLQTVARGKAARLQVRYTTLRRQDRRHFLERVLEERPPISPALYQWLGEQLMELRKEIRDQRDLGQMLREAADAIRDGDRPKAEAIRDRLQGRDWCGLEGSALKEYRRALKARDPRKLSRVAAQLERSDGDGSGGLQSTIDSLRRREIEAYELAMKAEDPKVRRQVMEALQLLNERERSAEALHAYGEAIRKTADPTDLWHLAEGYKELGDWKRARETFQRAWRAEKRLVTSGKGSRLHHADLYHWEIARALWGEGRHRDALGELELVSGEASERRERPFYPGGSRVRTGFVDNLVAQDAIPSLEAYRTLRTWLERQQRAVTGSTGLLARRDAGRALLRLALARRKAEHADSAWSAADRFEGAAEMMPVVAPIVLHAESSLFPDADPEASRAQKLIAADAKMRVRIEQELGIRIPGMLIRPVNDPQLQEGQYLVMLHEIPLGSGTAPRGQRGHWDPRAISASVERTVRRYLDTYLGVTEVQELLALALVRAQLADPSSEDARRLGRELASSAGDRRLRLVKTLQHLVREAVPVTRLPTILEQLDRSRSQPDFGELVDGVRRALIEPPPPSQGIGLGPEWEAAITGWVQDRVGKRFLAIPTGEESDLQRLLDLIATRIRELPQAVIVVPDDLRRFVEEMTADQHPRPPVCGTREWPGFVDQLQPLERIPQPETVK